MSKQIGVLTRLRTKQIAVILEQANKGIDNVIASR